MKRGKLQPVKKGELDAAISAPAEVSLHSFRQLRGARDVIPDCHSFVHKWRGFTDTNYKASLVLFELNDKKIFLNCIVCFFICVSIMLPVKHLMLHQISGSKCTT